MKAKLRRMRAAILGGDPANEEFSEKPLRVLRLKTKKAAIKQV